MSPTLNACFGVIVVVIVTPSLCFDSSAPSTQGPRLASIAELGYDRVDFLSCLGSELCEADEVVRGFDMANAS